MTPAALVRRKAKDQRTVLADSMSEAQLQDAVVKYARLKGYAVYHTHDSRRSDPGFPDLVMLRSNRLIFAELKTAKGKVRPEQAEWLGALEAWATVCALHSYNAQVYTWRPADWHSGEIERVLA